MDAGKAEAEAVASSFLRQHLNSDGGGKGRVIYVSGCTSSLPGCTSLSSNLRSPEVTVAPVNPQRETPIKKKWKVCACGGGVAPSSLTKPFESCRRAAGLCSAQIYSLIEPTRKKRTDCNCRHKKCWRRAGAAWRSSSRSYLRAPGRGRGSRV